MVADGDHLEPRFFLHLPRASRLDGFPRLHEAGEGRIAPLGPGGLAAEQALLAEGRQHDGHRIGAWEVFGLAAGADPLPARVGRLRGLAADRAERVAPSPFEQGPGGGGDPGLFRREPAPGHAQVGEPAPALKRTLRRIGVPGQLHGPDAGIAVQPQEHGPLRAGQLEAQAGVQRRQGQATLAVGDQGLAVPEGDHPAVRRGAKLGQPVRLGAQLAASVERVAGVGVDEEADGHGDFLAAQALQAKRTCVMSPPHLRRFRA